MAVDSHAGFRERRDKILLNEPSNEPIMNQYRLMNKLLDMGLLPR